MRAGRSRPRRAGRGGRLGLAAGRKGRNAWPWVETGASRRAPAADNPAPVAHFPFFFASFAWNYGLGMTWLAIPLYAHSQGLSAAQIGLLFSVPVVAQMAINLVGGAYTDRVGGRLVMLAAALSMGFGGFELVFAQGFWMLFCGQLLMVLSRATFWPANWALASELPGDRGTQVGRLNAISNLAQILGNASCGFVLAGYGFRAALACIAVLGFAAFLLGLATPPRRARARPPGGMFANYSVLARMPIIYYTLLCAYLSALPMTLSMSFFPLLLKEFGYGEEASGLLLALRAVGGIAVGLVLARAISTGPQSRWPVYGGLAVALSVGLMPVLSHWLALGVLMFAVGVGAGLQSLYVQITLAEVTDVEMRGSALALGGLGWSLSHLTTPLIAGLLAQYHGTVAGFYALGVIALGFVALIAVLRRRAFAGTPLTLGGSPITMKKHG